MDVKQPRPGEWVAGPAGALLLVSTFLPWYERGTLGCPAPPAECPPGELSAWQAFAVLDVVVALAALAGVGLLVLEATQRTPAITIAWAALTGLVAVIALIGVVYRTLDPPAGLGRELVFLGLATCGGVLAGAWLSMSDESDEARIRSQARATRAGGASERPPEPLPVPPVSRGHEDAAAR